MTWEEFLFQMNGVNDEYELADLNGIADETIDKIVNLIDKSYITGLSILGGEPMHPRNIDATKKLAKAFKDKYPNELSGGMRQRVALIRTLVTKPEILLLDEAFSALDYQTRLTICDDVYKIIKEQNLTAILVTHDISEAISMSDNIIVLTNRPAKVKNIYTIQHTPNTTPFERRQSKLSKEMFNVIWSDIQ